MALSDVSFDSGLSRHKFGNSNIRYSPDGRILHDEHTISLPRGRNYGAARDYGDYPRSNPASHSGYGPQRGPSGNYDRSDHSGYGGYTGGGYSGGGYGGGGDGGTSNFSDRREKARQAFYEYHGAYPSYESQSVQRQPPPPTTSDFTHDRARDRQDKKNQKNRSKSPSRPWSGQNDTGFDSPIHSYAVQNSWDQPPRSRESSPIRHGRYDTSQGYGTRDPARDPAPYPPPMPPTMDNRRGLPRDPYSSYGPGGHQKPDWHAPVVGDYHYDKTGLIAARNRNGAYGILGKWYHRRRDSPWSVLFLTLGMFLMLCGLVNVLICIDYHYYCRFWAGFIILEFGILGMIHGGDWRSRWKTYSYVLLGVLSVIAAFISTALVFEKYIPQIKLLADLDNATAYEELTKARDEPHVTVENDSWVWVCFGFDLTTVLLLILSYLAAHASASCANRFYEFNWKCTNPCEPYGKPRCFNPFGQIPLGEAMAFIGLCVRYGCEAYNNDTMWYEYWAPVVAGGLTAVAGSCAAGARKRTDNTGLMLGAIFLELLAGAGAVVAIVFCCIGLVDNVDAIENAESLPSKTKDHLTASAVLYGVAAGVCFIQVVYSVGVLAGLFSFLLGGQHRYYGDRRPDRRDRRDRRDRDRRDRGGMGGGYGRRMDGHGRLGGGRGPPSIDSRSQATVSTQRDRYGRYNRGADFPRNNYWR